MIFFFKSRPFHSFLMYFVCLTFAWGKACMLITKMWFLQQEKQRKKMLLASLLIPFNLYNCKNFSSHASTENRVFLKVKDLWIWMGTPTFIQGVSKLISDHIFPPLHSNQAPPPHSFSNLKQQWRPKLFNFTMAKICLASH